MLGTPAFMSPEQAERDLEALGPSSDIYGLGATLYHMLTGRPPISSAPLPTMIEAVRSGRFPTPRSLDRTIPRPLEAICLKAMALRPGDRYESASALANDLERWLADDPVSEWRDPLTTRLRRWAKRHRPVVAAAVSLLLTGVVALGIGLVLIDQERWRTAQQRDLARGYYKDARGAVNDLLVDLAERPEVRQADGFQPVRQAMLQRARKHLSRFLERRERMIDPDLERDAAKSEALLAEITEEIGSQEDAILAYARADDLFGKIPDFKGNRPRMWRRIGRLHRDLDHRDEAGAYLERARRAFGEWLARSDNPETHRELAATLVDLAMLARSTEGSARTLGFLMEARPHLEAAAPSASAGLRATYDLADLLDTIGSAQVELGRRGDAGTSLGEAETLRKGMYEDFPSNADTRQSYAETLHHLGDLAIKSGDFARALAFFQRARELRQETARSLARPLARARSRSTLSPITSGRTSWPRRSPARIRPTYRRGSNTNAAKITSTESGRPRGMNGRRSPGSKPSSQSS